MVAIEENNKIYPKIKISENVTKITNPGFKKVYRFYDKKTNKALADVVALADEVIPEDTYKIFDPENTWKEKVLTNYTVRCLQEQIFKNGELVYETPALKQICKKANEELETLWTEIRRLKNPHKYYIDLSANLWNLKNELLTK